MKTNSKKGKQEISIIEQKLNGTNINKLATESGFCKRQPRKITPLSFILALIQTFCGNKATTYSNWATILSFPLNDTISKQAVSKKLTKELVYFLQKILKSLLEDSVIIRLTASTEEKLRQFKRILIEDSTTIQLHNKFNKEYPGSRNNVKKEYAVVKIQSLYDLLKRQFIRLEITNFRNNDQSYSPKILDMVKKGDLIIRDLGYSVFKVFRQLLEKNVYFLSRLRSDVRIFDLNDEPIDLASMLQKRGTLDIEVFAGVEEKLPVRLVAYPVDDQVAERRRRNAKTNRDKRTSPSKYHLILLGWNIYMTNIESDKLSAADILKIYKLRWRIETIFKSWKSHLSIKRIKDEINLIKVEAFIYCMLIFVLIFHMHYYHYYLNKMKKGKEEAEISLYKFIGFVTANLDTILAICMGERLNIKYLDKIIMYYCRYEKRHDRINYTQSFTLS